VIFSTLRALPPLKQYGDNPQRAERARWLSPARRPEQSRNWPLPAVARQWPLFSNRFAFISDMLVSSDFSS
jgi:hypothetical protein